MTSPEEEQQKKSAEAKAKEPEKPAAPNDAINFVGQLIGDAKNLAFDAVAGQHSGDKVLSGITPKLAAQYQHGKDVQARIDSGAVKKEQLSDADKRSVEAFNSVRKSISHVPLYDRDSLMRYVEKGIEQKARSAPQEAKPAAQAVKSTQPDAHRPAAQATERVVPKDTHKPVPKEANRPVAQESSKPSTAKDAPGKPTVGKSPDQPVSKTPAASADTADPKKTFAQSPPQSHRDAAGSGASSNVSDAKTGGVKPAQFAQTQERGGTQSADGKGTPLKAQSEQGQINSSRDTGADSSKTSAQPANREVRQDVERQFYSPTGSLRSVEQNLPQRSAATEPRQIGAGESSTSKPTASQSSASSAFERRTSGNTKSEDMRSVLEERISAANNQSAKSKSQAPLQSKETGTAENVASKQSSDSESFAKTKNGTEQLPTTAAGRAEGESGVANSQPMQSRMALAEVKNTLSPQQVNQIIRYSEELFPAGLRWQNMFTRQESAPNPGATSQSVISPHATRQVEVSPSSAAPTSRSVDATPMSPAATSHGTVENTSGTPKPHQPGIIQPGSLQPGIVQPLIANPGIAQPGKTPSGSVHSENTRPGSSAAGVRQDLPQGGAEKLPGVSRPMPPSTPGANPQSNRDHKGGIVSDAQDRTIPNTKGMNSCDAGILTFRGRVENRYITGAEIALAAIIAAAGAKRVRFDELHPPGKDTAARMPLVQSIEAYLPERSSIPITLSESPADAMNSNRAGSLTDATIANRSDSNQETTDRKDVSRKPGDEEKQDSTAIDDSTADDVPGTLRYLQTHKYNRPSVLIGPGDTLTSIAEREFDDAIYGWLIADINLTKVKETYVEDKRVIEVRSRQTIELPTNEDRKAFLRHRKEEFKPENLITIVVETQIDRELLDEHLGVFVEGGAKSPGSSTGVPVGGLAVPTNPTAVSMFQRTTAGADGSLALPSLALESGNILRIATNQLKMLTRRAIETGRKPFSNLRETVKREKIKRRF